MILVATLGAHSAQNRDSTACGCKMERHVCVLSAHKQQVWGRQQEPHKAQNPQQRSLQVQGMKRVS